MNSDSFSSLVYNGTTQRGTLQGLTSLGTTESIFQMATDTGTANAYVSVPLQSGVVGSKNPLDINANPAVLSGNAGRPGGYRGAAPYFTTASFDCHPFVVSLAGRFTSSAVDSTTGHAFNLYQNTSAALGGNLIIGATSSATLAAGNYPFFIQATLMWDSVSHLLVGETVGVVAGQYTGRTAITPISVTSLANLIFVGSSKFNTGAANTVTPLEFTLSQI